MLEQAQHDGAGFPPDCGLADRWIYKGRCEPSAAMVLWSYTVEEYGTGCSAPSSLIDGAPVSSVFP